MIKTAAVILIICLAVPAKAKSTGATKLVLKTGVGTLDNEGTAKGSAGISGGFALAGHYFLTPSLSTGLGYMANFDLNNGRVPMSGYDLVGRYYFWGVGGTIQEEGSWGESVHASRMAAYAGAAYGYRSYFLGQDPLGTSGVDQLKGNYSVINTLIGVDYRLDWQFGLNAEFVYSLMSFAATDARIRIKETLFTVGINYNF